MESRIDEPGETPAVGHREGPHLPGAVRDGPVRAFDEHFAADELRIVVAELPLMRTVTDIGLAVGLAARIERIFGRNGVTVAENHRTAVGLGGDGCVTLRIVEHLETDAQRVEDHHQPHQDDQSDGHAPGPHHVTARAGMPPRIGEQHVDQSEAGDDHPLGLDVTAQRREHEEDDEGHGQELQRPPDGGLRLHLPPCLHVERHEEGVEDHQHVGQEFDDVAGSEDRVAARKVVGERRPVVLVLPHEVRNEQQQRHRAA